MNRGALLAAPLPLAAAWAAWMVRFCALAVVAIARSWHAAVRPSGPSCGSIGAPGAGRTGLAARRLVSLLAESVLWVCLPRAGVPARPGGNGRHRLGGIARLRDAEVAMRRACYRVGVVLWRAACLALSQASLRPPLRWYVSQMWVTAEVTQQFARRPTSRCQAAHLRYWLCCWLRSRPVTRKCPAVLRCGSASAGHRVV